jgi:hypothetical protein
MLNNEEALLFRSIQEPIRTGLSWNELWLGPDNGLICCWERGRQYRTESPEDATKAERGELVPIWWRGGVRKALKDGLIKTDGTLQYYATWLGLRNEDLIVSLRGSHTVVCTRTGQAVQYRPFSQWSEQLSEEQESAEATN